MAAFKHLAAKATTLVASGLHELGAVRINTAGTADTITIYDGIDATGIVVAVIAGAVAGADGYEYNVPCTTGICVVIGGTTAGDYTVTFT